MCESSAKFPAVSPLIRIDTVSDVVGAAYVNSITIFAPTGFAANTLLANPHS